MMMLFCWQNQKESCFAWACVTRMAVSEPDSDLHPQKTGDTALLTSGHAPFSGRL